ncbi:MAG TPA: sugar transferase [Egibacteraceae bacterium]|nr:sugar transferase [Egibacteraceae bacterium]
MRARLIALDVGVVSAAWVAMLGLWPRGGLEAPALPPLAIALGAAGTLAGIVAQRLYRARVCSIRAVEIQRLGRAAVVGGGAALVGGAASGAPPRFSTIAAAAGLTFFALVAARDGYRAWLSDRRRDGWYARELVVVGANEDALEVRRMIHEHPEMGYRVVGFVGAHAATRAMQTPWLGGCDEAVAAVRRTGASGALLVPTALSSHRLNDLTRAILKAGGHVHISSGLRGIAVGRLRPLPLAHEPLFYVEPSTPSRWRLGVKRALDLILACVALPVAVPLLVMAGIAIKLEDGGPVLFRQQRVGRHGRPFTMYKLRTMVPGAEQQRLELQIVNERSGGPLFKITADPRATRVGRLLRASGLDELPQIVNVLAGTMSMVGPRPALPDEVAQFDDELRERTRVRPGITGLWQVEARDTPQFGPYRRLDLFYVENWSVGLDLSILLATVGVVASRTWRTLRAAPSRAADGGPIVLD